MSSFDCNGGCGCSNAKIGKFVGAWIRLCSGLMRKKFVKDDQYCCLISNIYVKKIENCLAIYLICILLMTKCIQNRQNSTRFYVKCR